MVPMISGKRLVYFSVFSLLACGALGAAPQMIGQANAQFGGGGSGGNPQPIQTFSGPYTNADANLQISFPANWTGSVFQGRNVDVLTIRVAPNNVTTTQGFGGGAPYSMTLRIITKNSTSPANATTPIMMQPGQFGQGRNFGNRMNITCSSSAPMSVTINGMSGSVLTTQCSSANFGFQTKSYYFQSAQRTFIASFMARSTSDYNDHVAAFDNTVNTLHIANTIEAPSIVVPEFPVAILGVVFAAGIGAASFLLRTNRFRPF